MSIESALGDHLGDLVGNRIAPVVSAQPGQTPTWPGIRYTIIDTVPVNDRCGDGDDTKSLTRVQLDAIAKTFDAARALRLQIMERMKTFPVAARLDFSGPSGYDEETRTYRESLDFLIHGSPS